MELSLFVYIRQKNEASKERGPGTVLRGAGNTKALKTPEYNGRGDISFQVTYFEKTCMFIIIIIFII